MAHFQMDVAFQGGFGREGAHTADDLTGADPFAFGNSNLFGKAAGAAGEAAAVVNFHHPAPQGVLFHKGDGAGLDGYHVLIGVGGKIHAVVGAPVAHGGILDQLIFRKALEHCPRHRQHKLRG